MTNGSLTTLVHLCFNLFSVSDENFESTEEDKVEVVIEESPINTCPRSQISYEAVRTSSWLVGAILILVFLVARWIKYPNKISSKDLAFLLQLLENYHHNAFFDSMAGFLWHFCNRTTFTCSWCPPDWIVHDSRCYFMVNDTQTWEGAKEECNQYYAHLPIVLTAEDQVFLSKMATEFGKENNPGLWLGLRDETKDGNFIWVTEEKLSSNNSFWQPGNPKNTATHRRQKCVAIVPSKNYTEEDWYYTWNDVVCNSKRHFICETQDFLLRWKTLLSKEWQNLDY